MRTNLPARLADGAVADRPSAQAASPPEHALTFEVKGDTLVGLLHRPPEGVSETQARTGVVIVVGGPQVRAGSHRQFVHLARHLAIAGHPVLRFDVRGMGDSTGAQRSFEQLTPDIGGAIDALQRHQPQVQRVMLWGLCDGASAALLYLDETADPRVAGLALANPWVRSEVTLARTRVKHYYRDRLMQSEFWLKLLRGRVAGRALGDLWRNLRAARGVNSSPAPSTHRAAPFPDRMARAWRRFPGSVLLLLSGRDYTAREFLETVARDPAWHGALSRQRLVRVNVSEADHTFSSPAAQAALIDVSRQHADAVGSECEHQSASTA